MTRYAALVDEQRAGFEALATALLEKPVVLGECERYVVWPAAGEGPDRHVEDFAAVGIRLLVYGVDDAGVFRVRAGAGG